MLPRAGCSANPIDCQKDNCSGLYPRQRFDRIEIYTPKVKRKYGYYVLPILHGERLIGRIDPRMDRKTGVLHINAVYAEANAAQNAETRRAVAAAIEELAHFLDAKEIAYGKGVPVK
ncbi:MAG TPA: hypothetical protein G4N96_06680 [Chloroflexi bacterium]|nr:MAG: hypothetical protein B6243_12605 [Anaerolineaceae bacterium 4572_5.2]HEY84778.1 hypothetical protein [Chloroflexota bacterium]